MVSPGSNNPIGMMYQRQAMTVRPTLQDTSLAQAQQPRVANGLIKSRPKLKASKTCTPSSALPRRTSR